MACIVLEPAQDKTTLNAGQAEHIVIQVGTVELVGYPSTLSAHENERKNVKPQDRSAAHGCQRPLSSSSR